MLSYVSEDRPWADWIGTTLDRVGFRVVTHCADSDPEDLLRESLQAVSRTLVLLSPAYNQAHQTRQAWALLTAATVSPAPQRLITLRILDAKLAAPSPPSARSSCPDSMSSRRPMRC